MCRIGICTNAAGSWMSKSGQRLQEAKELPCGSHALLYLLHLTAMDGGNAEGLQEQSLPCSRVISVVYLFNG